MRSSNWLSFAFVSIIASTAALAGCTEPKGEIAGCSSDDQCKGVRVCGPQGECVSPLALADAGGDAGGDTGMSADAGADSSRPDTSTPDSGSNDTGNDTNPGACGAAPTASATIGTDGEPFAATVEAEPGATIELDASASSAAGGTINSYEWSVVEHPYTGALPHLKPKIATAAGGEASFEALAVGTYVIELTVLDSGGTESCNTVRLEAVVEPKSDIFVELVWDTPGDNDQTDDDGSDMDLHYKHPDGVWGYEPLDIFWYNATSDWGQENEDRDDPVLIRDDETGAGPESIAHDRPEELRYSVGVYYYDDYDFGPSDATVRVYIDGDLAHEVTGERLDDGDTFYEAVTINAGNETVTADDKHYDGYPPAE